MAVWIFSQVEAIEFYDVEVTWIVNFQSEFDHTITYQGESFTASSNTPVVKTHKLYGGSNGNFFFTKRGWSIKPRLYPLSVDGVVIDRSSIESTSSGTWVILGISSKPRLKVEINLPQ